MEYGSHASGPEALEQDIREFDGCVLERLLEEVRNNQVAATGAYNRVHNRHNR